MLQQLAAATSKVQAGQRIAFVQSGWHLYSQSQPEDAVAEPTKITFNKNALLKLDGNLKEEGKLEKFHDAKLDLSAN
jgi:thiol:disulfide interchange protein DsbD